MTDLRKTKGRRPISREMFSESDHTRFWAKVRVNPENGCWEWTGNTLRKYGRFKFRNSSYLAYRCSYALVVGQTPVDTLELDHLCRNPLCVRADHLEAVPHKTNVLRGESPSALHARKTKCRCGRDFTPCVLSSGKKIRTCIPCRREKDRERTRAA